MTYETYEIPDPSPELECALSIRAKIAEIAVVVDAAELESIKLKPRPLFDPEEVEQVMDVMHVIRLLSRVLDDCRSYWDEEYLAEMED